MTDEKTVSGLMEMNKPDLIGYAVSVDVDLEALDDNNKETIANAIVDALELPEQPPEPEPEPEPVPTVEELMDADIEPVPQPVNEQGDASVRIQRIREANS